MPGGTMGSGTMGGGTMGGDLAPPPTGDLEPDIDGFVEAQERKRAKMGQPVLFFSPAQTVWPSGIPIDESGTPLDPSVLPLASGMASGYVNAEVVNRPVAGGARGIKPHSEDTPIGRKDHTSLILIVTKSTYDQEELQDATEAEVFGFRYALRDAEPDQMGDGPVQRMLIFAERK